jgi:5'-phosphate synthase pdxT subunit
VRVGVLALQGSFVDHARLLAAVGAEPIRVRDARSLASVDGLVVPGGESTTMWHVARRSGMMAPVHAALAEGLPAFGTCAGMVMLASEVLDGAPGQETWGAIAMTVRRNAFGRQVDSFEAAVDIPVLAGGSFPGVFIRAPWVAAAATGVEVLARVGDRIVAVRQGSVMATAFHPELTDDARLHAAFVEMVESAAE